jgi:glycerol-3-phosphate dehydrogenase
VLGSFAGLRVLPGGEGHAFHRSRETLLHADRARQPRVLSVYGGKLTTWRAVSARALLQVSASLPQRRALARTDQLMLR